LIVSVKTKHKNASSELQVTCNSLWLLTGAASVVIAPNPEGYPNPVVDDSNNTWKCRRECFNTRAAPPLVIPPCIHSLNFCCFLSCLIKIDVGGHKQKLFAKILGDALDC
jgi:hypothetical protein